MDLIVRIDLRHHPASASHWQLTRCQVQLGGMFYDVIDPASVQPIRFEGIEDTIRHAKKVTFAFLEARHHKDMPDQMDWRVYQDDHLFPCPVCQQPMYRKAKLGRYGTSLDLKDWGCARCKKTVTLNTDGLLPHASVTAPTTALPISPLPERMISLASAPQSQHARIQTAEDPIICVLPDRFGLPQNLGIPPGDKEGFDADGPDAQSCCSHSIRRTAAIARDIWGHLRGLV